MKAKKNDLVGRKIKAIEWNKFDDGRGKQVTDPVLILDNGVRVAFVTIETEVGEYGIQIVVQNP
jgi:hypothetical protein